MITWIRPSGTEITLSDNKASNDVAKANGWKRKSDKTPSPKKSSKKAK